MAWGFRWIIRVRWVAKFGQFMITVFGVVLFVIFGLIPIGEIVKAVKLFLRSVPLQIYFHAIHGSKIYPRQSNLSHGDFRTNEYPIGDYHIDG
jgi:hypothetical protein